MQLSVEIDGKRREYNLERVHYLSDLPIGTLVIVIHPESGETCRAEVRVHTNAGLVVRDTAAVPAPYQWYIKKTDFYRRVYKINKQS